MAAQQAGALTLEATSLRIFALLLGIVLLLPGGCAISYTPFMVREYRSDYNDPYFPIAEAVWAISFLISFVGLLLIRYALRVERDDRPRSGDPPAKPR